MREQQYGKYLLLDRIAVGGMAEIFLARQMGPEGFEKTVVLKRIRPHLGDKKSFVRMFLNEAKLAAQLNHPNIIHIHDLGKVIDAGAAGGVRSAETSYFIAMEYLFGRDMRRVLPKCEQLGIAFPIVYACKIASQVLEGLYYAHQKTDLQGRPLGIVHRDVTPENIFVSFDGGVKVLDFGIAKAANQVEMTRAGEIKGKLSYMSPEQCMGKPLDSRSDIFSLGVVLYEWVTGFKLFTGESDVAVLKSITDGKIYKPSYFKGDVPEQIEQILMRALEKDPAQRYQTAWEMQYDLDKFLANNEFTPSNQHLATFMKQVFADEMDAERARLSGSPEVQRLASLDVDKLTEENSSGPRYLGVPTPRQTTLPGRGQATNLEVQFAPEELAHLTDMASRNETTVPALVREIVQSFLRFR
ncbi:MAG: serine/threonine protein kinase [Deltaproteobacteria bacterium]|nr:MAG: serine/threonine protein kinase [Deltaproteobacteria bacterium]